jgi:hypothetical protein
MNARDDPNIDWSSLSYGHAAAASILSIEFLGHVVTSIVTSDMIWSLASLIMDSLNIADRLSAAHSVIKRK